MAGQIKQGGSPLGSKHGFDNPSFTKQVVQVVDLFSGCGGMSYGFARAPTQNLDYRIVGALDIDRHANATYERMIGVKPVHGDIRDLSAAEAVDTVTHAWHIDRSAPLLVIACAPCQGFSSHRKRYDREDKRNTLLLEIVSFVKALRPEIVVMENVPEMLHVDNWGHFEQWKNELQLSGYAVRTRIYSMAQFGVPQERFRTLAIACRNWKSFEMPRPTCAPSNFKTVRQAIGPLPPLGAGEADPRDPMHVTSRHRKETVELLRHIPKNGGSQRDLPPTVGPACLRRVDGFRDVYGRLFWDRPANAITTRCRTPSAGRYAHPEQDRGLSVREAALLQGFPSDYFFEGPFDDKFKQIGNAVCPPFAQSIAENIDSEWTRDHGCPIDTKGDIVAPIRKSMSSALASIKRIMRDGRIDIDFGPLLGI